MLHSFSREEHWLVRRARDQGVPLTGPRFHEFMEEQLRLEKKTIFEGRLRGQFIGDRVQTLRLEGLEANKKAEQIQQYGMTLDVYLLEDHSEVWVIDIERDSRKAFLVRQVDGQPKASRICDTWWDHFG